MSNLPPEPMLCRNCGHEWTSRAVNPRCVKCSSPHVTFVRTSQEMGGRQWRQGDNEIFFGGDG